MAGRRQFRPSIVITVAATLFCALTIALGVWQMRRAEQREALQMRIERLAAEPPVAVPGQLVDGAAVALRRVSARGEYADRYTILLDNKVHQGRVGYHVLSPLRIGSSDVHVLVDRGWVPAGRTRAEVPLVAAPPGERTVAGIAVVPSARVFELKSETPEGVVWQNLVLGRYRAWSGLKLQPFVIRETDEAGDGLVRAWERLDAGADRNRGYALQWFSLAALTLVLYATLGLRQRAGAVER